MILQTSFQNSLLSVGRRRRATIGARTPEAADADDTLVERKQFGVLLCLPMAPVLLLIQNGDLGTSPIYGHRRARHNLPLDTHVGGAGHEMQ